jgi:hypothetical protein
VRGPLSFLFVNPSKALRMMMRSWYACRGCIFVLIGTCATQILQIFCPSLVVIVYHIACPSPRPLVSHLFVRPRRDLSSKPSCTLIARAYAVDVRLTHPHHILCALANPCMSAPRLARYLCCRAYAQGYVTIN